MEKTISINPVYFNTSLKNKKPVKDKKIKKTLRNNNYIDYYKKKLNENIKNFNSGNVDNDLVNNINVNNNTQPIETSFSETLHFLNSLKHNNEIKKKHSIKKKINHPHINIDLPEELINIEDVTNIENTNNNINEKKSSFTITIEPEIKIDTSVVDNSILITSQPQPHPVLEQKTEIINIPVIPIQNNDYSYNLKKQPLYSCLKNSSRPTYRQLKKLNANNSYNPRITINDKPDIENSERYNKFEEIKNNIKNKINNNVSNNVSNNFRTNTVKSVRKKLIVGKNGKTLSIYIKNKKTRKIIQNEVDELLKTPIPIIRNYLINHKLLKIGSNASDEILIEMYKQSKLTGEIINKNSETLLHNYFTNNK